VKNSRIYTLICASVFAGTLLACGGGGGGSSSSSSAPATGSTNAIGQLSQGLAEKGKVATIISSGNQANQLADNLATNGYQTPPVTVASPAVQLEATTNQLSRK
jgi:hypothetical protein